VKDPQAAKVKAVIEKAEQLLPGRKMSEWQRSWCTRETVEIYVRGRDGDTEKAAEILAEALSWRAQYQEVLSGARVPRWQSDFRVLARAESGHPILFCCLRHVMVGDTQATIESMAVVFEEGVRSMRGDAKQYDVVLDIHGFSFRHMNPSPMIPFFRMMRQPFRDRLRTIILVGASRAFSFLTQMTRPMMDEKTHKKVIFKPPTEAVAHVSRVAGNKAGQTLQAMLDLDREGKDCQPGEIPGRRMPSELDDRFIPEVACGA